MNLLIKSVTVLVGCVASWLFISLGSLLAQDQPAPPQVVTETKVQVNPQQPPPPGQPAPGQSPKAIEKPGAPGKADPKATEKPAESGKPVRKPAKPANPDELNIRPGEDGLISFSFKGQEWQDVLEWLADISGLSLQMEEVPPGWCSLTTRRRYTTEEARDEINGVLINKGYTLLRDGDVLLLAKLATLDKSLVPRVDPKELDERGKFEFVKTLFDLKWLVAETMAEELKPMLSPKGQIVALKTTNRLDIVETAGNLRRIRDFLAEEQSGRGEQYLVREFKLRYTRASEVLDMLNTLLGIKAKAAPPAPMNPEQMAMMQQQAAMAAQQAQQRGGAPPGAPKGEPQIYLTINKGKNSILANAAPDKLGIIEQAILAIDIPQNKSASLLANLPMLNSYHVSSADPAALVKVLEDLGNLDPQTRLEVDNRSKAIIAFATPLDHVAIQSMIHKIDGSGRKFEVIQLHTLEAEMAAGSIEFLMRGAPETNKSTFDPFYGYYDGGRGRSSQQKDPSDQLQVEADTDRNRLLLRATDVELKEIRALLEKLGEFPESDRSNQTMRMIPMSPGEMQKLIQRLQNAWPSVAPNPLKVEPVEPPAEPTKGKEEQPTPKAEPKRAVSTHTGRDALPVDDKSIISVANHARSDAPSRSEPASDRAELSRSVAIATMDLSPQPPETDDPPGEPKQVPASADEELMRQFRARRQLQPRTGDQPAPISITAGPNGLVISSQDTEALDRMEELLVDLMPERNGSKIFQLKNTYAKKVAELLKDAFKEGDSEKKPTFLDDSYYYYRFGAGSRSQEKGRSRLSKRKQLKFIPDPITNTILVQGADSNQLAEVERLIKHWDNPEPPNSNSVRMMEKITVHYTTAKEVADVIKDVFRDLLSPNDKALKQQGQQQQQEQPKSLYSNTYIIGGDSDKDNAREFKGLLSIGVDDRSNTIVVSAPKDLMTIILQMAQELDDAARETRRVVQVMKLGTTLSSENIHKALQSVGHTTAPTTTSPGTPEGGAKPQPQQPNQPAIAPQ